MNSVNFKTVKNFTRVTLFLLASVLQVSVKAWDVDMSRRQKELTKSRMPATIVDSNSAKSDGVMANFFESIELIGWLLAYFINPIAPAVGGVHDSRSPKVFTLTG